jgi:hypothetical protein
MVKAVGAGLNFDLRGFCVPLVPHGGFVLIDGPKKQPGEHWLLLDVPLGVEYVAALALPASAMCHGANPTPDLVQAQSVYSLGHCEEIDVLPLASEAGSLSGPDSQHIRLRPAVWTGNDLV